MDMISSFLHRNLSRHLVHIKECQLKSSGSHAKPVEDKDEVVASNEDLLQQRNFELLGRMELLQKDNRRLEKCITQLKFIADMVRDLGVWRRGMIEEDGGKEKIKEIWEGLGVNGIFFRGLLAEVCVSVVL